MQPLTPVIDSPDAAKFWEAAAEGRLLLRVCRQTGAVSAFGDPDGPPAGEAYWLEASGEGVIESVSAEGGAAPIARVRLPEGPAWIGEVVGPGAEEAVVGEAVRVAFAAAGDGVNLPCFLRAATNLLPE